MDAPKKRRPFEINFAPVAAFGGSVMYCSSSSYDGMCQPLLKLVLIHLIVLAVLAMLGLAVDVFWHCFSPPLPDTVAYRRKRWRNGVCFYAVFALYLIVGLSHLDKLSRAPFPFERRQPDVQQPASFATP